MWCGLSFQRKTWKRRERNFNSSSAGSRLSPIIPTSQFPSKKLCLIHFHGIICERHFSWPGGQRRRWDVSSPGPLLTLWGLSGSLCLSLHSAKGVEYFFLQVNYKARSVFRKCFKTPGEMKTLRALWISIPVTRCYFFRWRGALSRVKFRVFVFCPGLLSWVQMWMMDWLLVAKLEMFYRDLLAWYHS